ncbi:MAG: ABC transporter permease [Rhodovulum sulfidophilum]|uniref:ABC transporter permease n=1 Tax=Rhodovulum sulfidophilum TaxID=35806 RepID=A0A2W5N687_RHOSU|nr:MAG: ABC transporter permease [Rhodovulum sulfidophilum]
MQRFSLAVGVFAAILALWAAASALGWVDPFLLPPPARVWTTFLQLLGNGKLAAHVEVSLLRVAAGYGIAVALALALSLLMSRAAVLDGILDPPLEFLRQIPPLAMIPLIMLWLGIGEAQKVGIIVLACFFPIFLGFRGGFAQADPKLIEVGRAAGFGRSEILRRIVIPAALPAIIVGLRIGLGYGWRALVGAELIASSSGLGYMILDAQDLARTDIVLVGVLVIGVIGLLTDGGLKFLVRRRLPWIRRELDLGQG